MSEENKKETIKISKRGKNLLNVLKGMFKDQVGLVPTYSQLVEDLANFYLTGVALLLSQISVD